MAPPPAASGVGILVSVEGQMQAVAIADHIAADDVGASPVDTITARDNVVFWFDTSTRRAVNRMATLNLYAATRLPAHAVPLLHGTVLITGIDAGGDPVGLSSQQLKSLQARPAPNWWARLVLRMRSQRAVRRQRA
ncbi:hypothetical protein HMPREF0591_1683 [Mycobacterium parascrofulaceum ATCC BAA-614]|uniref:Uncharacterized protein n=1 Tax=Mycobacterium parascrofulaceum ATCC BAA-614 TaxID=525368 RepID=D5P689_9MYCO|nr:hypothetical protein [Mycobacterium parascrofulaceum]EFG78391.1 hypothetical protein HMPREF0591_1683 [Mycobacterium parascrofulaceum ATCC BAA-614]